MLSVPQPSFVSTPTSLNRPGLKAQMGKPRLRKFEDQIDPWESHHLEVWGGKEQWPLIAGGGGGSHTHFQTRSPWLSTTASSGLHIVPHGVTLGHGFSKDQSCIDSLGLTPLLPLCLLPPSTSWATVAPPALVFPIESHTPLDQVQLPRDRGTPTLAWQPGQPMDARPSPSWPASPLPEQPQPGPPCTVSGPSLLRRRFQLL